MLLQCFIVSTVNALQTPMINAAMVISSFIFFILSVLSIIFHFLNCLGEKDSCLHSLLLVVMDGIGGLDSKKMELA